MSSPIGQYELMDEVDKFLSYQSQKKIEKYNSILSQIHPVKIARIFTLGQRETWDVFLYRQDEALYKLSGFLRPVFPGNLSVSTTKLDEFYPSGFAFPKADMPAFETSPTSDIMTVCTRHQGKLDGSYTRQSSTSTARKS